MKIKIAAFSALVALATGVYVTTIWAQAPGTAAQAPTSVKVGLVNLAGVLKGFNKFKLYNDEMEKIFAPFEAKDKELKTLLKQWQEWGQRQTSQADQFKAQEMIKNIARQIEDNGTALQKAKGLKSDEQMVQMYKEIEVVIARYAATNGFHLILQYSEPLTDTDKYAPPNIQRKLLGPGSAGSVGPLYVGSGLEVTADVVNQLNNAYPTAAPAATPPAGKGGGS